MFRASIDKVIALYNGFLAYVRTRTPTQPFTVLDELEHRVAREAADYVGEKMGDALSFVNRHALIGYALTRVLVDGVYAEFGVWKGSSISRIAAQIDGNTIY